MCSYVNENNDLFIFIFFNGENIPAIITAGTSK